MGNLFSTRGRINRKQYFLLSLTIILIAYAFAFAIGFVSGVSDSDVQNATMMGLGVGVAGCAMQSLLIVRRLHDLGKPGSHLWLIFVPFYGIYLSLVLCFTRGSDSTNQYGPAPA